VHDAAEADLAELHPEVGLAAVHRGERDAVEAERGEVAEEVLGCLLALQEVELDVRELALDLRGRRRRVGWVGDRHGVEDQAAGTCDLQEGGGVLLEERLPAQRRLHATVGLCALEHLGGGGARCDQVLELEGAQDRRVGRDVGVAEGVGRVELPE
jgi:hypothetical protein